MPGTARKPAAKRAPRKAATVAVPVDTEDPSLAIEDAGGASVQPVDEHNAPIILTAEDVAASRDNGICVGCYPAGWPGRFDYASCEHGEWSRSKDDAAADELPTAEDA